MGGPPCTIFWLQNVSGPCFDEDQAKAKGSLAFQALFFLEEPRSGKEIAEVKVGTWDLVGGSRNVASRLTVEHIKLDRSHCENSPSETRPERPNLPGLKTLANRKPRT